jgi:hypothetical protein
MSGKFNRRKIAALASLLECSTITEAAAHCKINERTLRRWLADENFSERYHAECGRLLDGAIDALRGKSLAAVETMTGMSSGVIPASSARLSAARAIVELAIRGTELQELEERLSDLEEIAKEHNQ